MITPSFSLTSTERVLPKLALDFTTASLDPRITFTRTTSASNPATYINSSGTITAATNNQPRFDYDPVTLLCKGLLIEESRTNSLLNTDLLSTQVVTVTAAVRTLSFYGTGSVTLSGAHTAVVSGTGAYPTRTTYSFTPTAGALTLAVTGAVQYAQLEAGAFATSYIPTTTTALTRNADVATMTGTNFSDWYNATEGTLLGQGVRYTAPTAGRFPYFLSLNTDTSNRIDMYQNAATTEQTAVYYTGSQVAALNKTAIGANLQINHIASYKTNNFVSTVNAATVATDTAGNVPTCNQMYIGHTGGAFQFGGWIQQIFYWPQQCTNAEVQAFSK